MIDSLRWAAQCGFATTPDWIKTPCNRNQSLEQMGYDLFTQLWQQESKPEVLLVYPDIVARGAVSAILQQNVSVPEELKLVFHKNNEVNLFHPFPAAHVITDVSKVSNSFMNQLKDYMVGKTTPVQIIRHRLELNCD